MKVCDCVYVCVCVSLFVGACRSQAHAHTHKRCDVDDSVCVLDGGYFEELLVFHVYACVCVCLVSVCSISKHFYVCIWVCVSVAAAVIVLDEALCL